MIRFGKPSAPLLRHKQSFFEDNDQKRAELGEVARVYAAQPPRTRCKNCEAPLGEPVFNKLGVDYVLCGRCGHLNGAREDTEAFCNSVYTEEQGREYAKNYQSQDLEQYQRRLDDIYLPKARFLAEALIEAGETPEELSYADMGAGSGYFVGALKKNGMKSARGFEVSTSQVDLANAMLGDGALICHGLGETSRLIAELDADVISFIGVLEHLRDPRSALAAVAENPCIRYMFFSLPLFSACVFFEMVFPGVMPRHLAGGHTHLYTESSIDHFCSEFGFMRLAEWWFGADMVDLYRSVMVSLLKNPGTSNAADAWVKEFAGVIDDMQLAMDAKRLSSEVHMLVGKKP